jgi:hypothetical protein
MAAITATTSRLSGDLRMKWAGELTDPQLVLDCIGANLFRWKAAQARSIRVKLRGNDLKHLNFFN